MSMKEKTFVPPKPPPESISGEVSGKIPDATPETAPSRVAGFILISLGVLLMIFSGWTPFSGETVGKTGVGDLENVSASSGESSVVRGGPGNDDLYGEPGRDIIVGGAGDDFIEAKDGSKDHISCGPGDDVASVDELDIVASDCETVYRS